MTTMNAETNDGAAGVAAQGATLTPEKPASKKPAGRKKGTPRTRKTAKGAKAGKHAPPKGRRRIHDPGGGFRLAGTLAP
jgi:hypothetical protein